MIRRSNAGAVWLAMDFQLEHTFLVDEVHMTEHNGKPFEAKTMTYLALASESAMKESRLPDKPWKYNPPPPPGVVRPKPVLVPKGK